MNENKYYVLLFLILLGCFIVRLYRFNNPIADWHSWRQVDTSAVSRTFVQEGYDILHPKFEDISNVQNGGFYENPQGYRFVEFPIFNILQAAGYQAFGMLTLEEWGRMLSIISSLFVSLFLFLIVRRYSSDIIGLLAAFFYAFLPFDIYYGRTVLPDTMMVMAALGGIYFFDLWIKKSSTFDKAQAKKLKVQSSKLHFKTQSFFYFFLAILFTISALLLKPYALFFLLPMLVIAYQAFGIKFFTKWQLWIFAIVSVLPLIWWRTYMLAYPEGIPQSAWLLNSNHIRFRPAFFWWIGYERLTKLISGYIGVILLVIGTFSIFKSKNPLFFLSFLLASIVYVCTFATGNVQHDYYQILIMPSIAIVYAFGAYYLAVQPVFNKQFPFGKIAVLLLTIGTFYVSWYYVKDYFDIDNPAILVAGQAVDKLTPKNAKVIANYNGDTTFLYYTNRKGWASYEHSFPQMVKLGADYLVIANPVPSDFDYGKQYKIIAKNQQYVIFNLREKP